MITEKLNLNAIKREIRTPSILWKTIKKDGMELREMQGLNNAVVLIFNEPETPENFQRISNYLQSKIMN